MSSALLKNRTDRPYWPSFSAQTSEYVSYDKAAAIYPGDYLVIKIDKSFFCPIVFLPSATLVASASASIGALSVLYRGDAYGRVRRPCLQAFLSQ
ncbi:hypothetical protein [Massilia psychrophila]|uniref:hypothetical protein n=1 Tax=Massilia psychrophila TaxID=1603353 RepID=UPI00117D8D81|nr:hypothetical protein [Massilia psychrophila]GGE82228.1 hypothetical protein GCM10008020_28940 [Massilia psychrophila]